MSFLTDISDSFSGIDMSSVANIGSEIGGIFQQQQGFQTETAGFEAAASAAQGGGQLAASVFNQGAASALAIGQYNQSLTAAAENKAEGAFSNQIFGVFSKNRAIGAYSGLAATSGSLMATMNTNMTNSETTLNTMRTGAAAVEAQQGFEAALTSNMYTNDALNAQYQGQVNAAIYNYRANAAQAQGNSALISGIGNVIGDVVGSFSSGSSDSGD